VDEKLHKTKRALKSTRKKLSAQEERHSKEIQGLAAQLAQMRSELLAVSTSQLQMSTTDPVEDDSESILENSDYKMLTREETRSTPRVVSFADELDESRHPEKSSHTITTHSESTISGHSSSLRLRRQPRRGSTGSFLVDLVPDAFISIQGEQSSS
jgi:phage shock protein A